MKKFLLFALCAISACSVFAEPFSIAKYRELKQNKKHLQAINYCYQSEISSESDYNHLYQYINKLAIDKNFKLTKNEIDQCIKKFDNAPKLTELNKQNIAVAFYTQCGLTSDAEKIINENNASILKLVFFRNSFNGARKSLNKQLMWKYG